MFPTHLFRLFLFLGLCACQTANRLALPSAPPALDAVDVVWNTPSAGAAGSMPLGNGQTVLNAWVEEKTGDLLFLVARTDSLSEVCRFLKLGIVRIHLDGNPLADAKDFKQELHLREGMIRVSGNGVALRVLVDSRAQVVHVAGESGKPFAVFATVQCWRNAEEKIPSEGIVDWTVRGAPFPMRQSPDVFADVSADAVAWYHRNEESVVPKLLEEQSLSCARGAFDPLLHRTSGGWLSGDGFVRDGLRGLKSSAPAQKFHLTLATCSAQTPTARAWIAKVREEAEKSRDFAQAQDTTAKYWGEFWGRSWVFAKETQSFCLPANKNPLRVGADSNGGSPFPGDIRPQAVLAHAWTAGEAASAFSAGCPMDGSKTEPVMPEMASALGLTLSAWVKPAATGTGRIFDKITSGGSDGFLFDMQGGALRFIVGGEALQSPVCLKIGAWQNVAATVDHAGRMAVYLDGKPVAIKAGTDGGGITRGWTLQRFSQGIQGRGTYPIKFNGGFSLVGEGYLSTEPNDRRAWGDCYWWQNTRHMYHPMLACGDFDLMKPLFEMYENARPLAEARTALYHPGAQGVYFPETMTLFGTYAGGDYGWNRSGRKPDDVVSNYTRHIWSPCVELVSLMLDRYDYTQDETFLKKELLPMAQGVLRQFETRFGKDAAGKLVIDPTQVVEACTHDVVNDTPTVAGLIGVTRRLCALPERLTTPEERALFSRMRAACPDLPMRGEGEARRLTMAQRFTPDNPGTLENPELYAIWPYREISLSRPEFLQTARASYSCRFPVGWGYAANCAALLGLADESARLLQIKCANSDKRYRWPAYWGPNADGVNDQNHGGNLLETTNLMLIQGEAGGKILLLPAWPQKWDVDFKLHAPDQTTVECQLKDGKITRLKVNPESRRKDVVMPEWVLAPVSR